MDFYKTFKEFSYDCTLREEIINQSEAKCKGNIDSYSILGPCVEDECMFWRMYKMIEQHHHSVID